MTSSLPLHAIEFNTLPRGRSYHVPMHRHQHLTEMLWVEAGPLELVTPTGHHVIKSGSLVLIPAGAWHAWSVSDSEEQRWHRLLLTATTANGKICITAPAGAALIPSLYRELAREFESKNTLSSKARLLIDWLWLTVARHQPQPLPLVKSIKMSGVMHTMEEKCHSSFSLADAANEAGLSKFHFSRLFKEASGHTPLQFIISCRMERAQQLLAMTEEPVAAIAERCGYKSVTQFHAAFTRHTAMTPKRCREQGLEAKR